LPELGKARKSHNAQVIGPEIKEAVPAVKALFTGPKSGVAREARRAVGDIGEKPGE
jgi:hypothetical protein